MIRPLSSWQYGLLAGCVAALTVYGSLVPFEYVPRNLSNVIDSFEWVLKHRTRIESKSDGLANLFLGLPLGFFLLAAFRVDQRGRTGTVVTAVLLWPVCVVFAAGVELTQLWFPKRTCSATDIMAQGLGSAMGMMLWLILGQWFTDFFRGLWTQSTPSSRPSRLLILYLFLLLTIQVLPFDVTTSPKEIAGRFWHQRNVVLVPFAEWQTTVVSLEQRDAKICAWLKLVVLFGTVGTLTTRWRLIPLVWGAVLFCTLAEIVQGPVLSRTPSTTDVIVCTVAIISVWLHSVVLEDLKIATKASLGFAFVVGTMAMANWWPLDFSSDGPQRLSYRNVLPFASVESQHYLFLLEQTLETITIWGVAGAFVVQIRPGRTAFASSIIVAMCSLVVEVGQIWLPNRTPASTDVLLAAVGSYFGAYIAQGIWSQDRSSR